MLCWPLGEGDDLVERLTLCFTYGLDELIDHGHVWEAGDAAGGAIWVPPDGHDLAETAWSQPRLVELADDEGRYEAFWDWAYDHYPDDPHWDLDSLAVDPAHRGRGLGSALIAAGLDQARATGVAAFLGTGSAGNVSLYERAGFRVVEDADAPDGGPHIWFMRWDP
jgi:GNAT superfamily N-acetyltransferase